MALLCRAEGTSILTEHIFENRFMQVPQLRKMGASITVRGRNAIVRGVLQLHGARVAATDLRAGAALVLAGLTAEGHTTVTDIAHIERGYVDLAGALASLGAPISRVE
jgi:UDP-N-acetylglucosamine 1-carboxyvinyltransferase